MNAIIIAAGMGRRMGPMTQGLPKCLAISWNGQTLLDEQLAVLRGCGVQDISLVRGYCGEQFRQPDIRYHWNHEFRTNNILASLMCAREDLGETLVLYSDIWFEPSVAAAVLRGKGDIVIGVDADWRRIYEGRTDHPESEAETASLNPDGTVARVGKIALRETGISGEFIGMMKLSKSGSRTLLEHYDRARANNDAKVFQRAPSFRQAYLTDMLQELIDSGVAVQSAVFRGGWREIDTVQDFKNLMQHLDIRGRGAPLTTEETHHE